MISGGDWIAVCNPKAASTSLRAALGEFPRIAEVHVPLCSARLCDGARVRAVIIRNPYDRIVSGWVHNARDGEPFDEWLKSGTSLECGVGLDFKRVPQRAWAQKCNALIRFEHLDQDFDHFCRAVKIAPRPFPHEGAGRPRPHYRDMIDSKSRAIVEDRFAPDFEAWGYRW